MDYRHLQAESEGPGKEAFQKKPEREFKIKFEAQGYAEQTVVIFNPDMTPEKLQRMLNSGVAATTIQEGGTVDVVADGKALARVVNVDNHLEYSEFEVEDETD